MLKEVVQRKIAIFVALVQSSRNTHIGWEAKHLKMPCYLEIYAILGFHVRATAHKVVSSTEMNPNAQI